MLPPFMGVLLLFGFVATMGLAFVVGLVAWARQRHRLARRAGLLGGGASALYASAWIFGLVLSRQTELPPGATVCFGGFDCHLHVAVAEVHEGDGLGITVRFSSDAVRAPEWPGALRFRLRDATGREYAPTNEVPDVALAAGESRAFELEFPKGIAPGGAALMVTWKSGLHYLVPGSGNPLVQARHRLLLPATSRSGG